MNMIKKSLFLVLPLFLAASLGQVMAPISAEQNTAESESDTYLTYFPLIFKEENKVTSQSLDYGLNFISSAEAPSNNDRYNKAISAGATWNRWPLYWYYVETSPGNFNWSYADAVVAADKAKGLKTEIILMGTPGFYSTRSSTDTPLPDVEQNPEGWRKPDDQNWIDSVTSSTPTGLYEKIFCEGPTCNSDTPGSGKTINPANKWALFVFGAVNHYSQLGITHFEIWNEPDYTLFWTGSVSDYARLLKVGYLAAEQANPNVKIIFGGLTNWQQPNFLSDVLAIFNSDSKASKYNWFFDIFATHSYSYAWESWYHVWRAGEKLDDYGLNKPIWLNESGVPAWNDYPGPTWDPTSQYRATMKEMASYVIQSALYARFVNAEVIFHFQLFDDCGNQDPSATAGDAYGLFRNPSNAICFHNSPNPNTARPAFIAYQVLTKYLTDLTPLKRKRVTGASEQWQQEWIYFSRAETGEQVLAIWSRYGENETAKVTAIGSSATLIDQYGNVSTITPKSGKYTLTLEKATNQNTPSLPNNLYAIGGPPLILIEKDTRAPEVTLFEPQVNEQGEITLSWQGEDKGLGVKDYDVWVSIDGGPMTKWLDDTPATRITISGNAGKVYGFAVVGRDLAGNYNNDPAAPVVEVDLTNALSEN